MTLILRDTPVTGIPSSESYRRTKGRKVGLTAGPFGTAGRTRTVPATLCKQSLAKSGNLLTVKPGRRKDRCRAPYSRASSLDVQFLPWPTYIYSSGFPVGFQGVSLRLLFLRSGTLPPSDINRRHADPEPRVLPETGFKLMYVY